MSIRQYARRALSTTGSTTTGQRALRTTSASRRPLSTTAAAALDLSPEFPAAVRTLLETHSDSLLSPHGTPNCMAPGQQVFCNRELRFDRVNVLGFDYDYTLASYRLELQDFIYAKARDHLVERLHYPPALAERSYDREFPIRGLVFDLPCLTQMLLQGTILLSGHVLCMHAHGWRSTMHEEFPCPRILLQTSRLSGGSPRFWIFCC